MRGPSRQGIRSWKPSIGKYMPFLIVVLVTVLAVTGVAHRPQRDGVLGTRGQAARCSDFTPRVLAVLDSFAVYVDSPEIARSAEGSFVIGWPAFAATRAGKKFVAPGASEAPILIGARI